MANSAATAGWWPGDRSADRSNAGLWGHLSPHILIGAILASVVMVIRPLPPGSAAATLAPVALVAVVVATWLQLRRHDRSLCELCMASMPLNASEAAHRYRRRLAVAHLATHRPALIAMVGVLVGFDLALVLIPTAWVTYAGYAWAAVQLSLVYLVLSHTTHRRLQPWCPECRDGGGGSGVDTPEPVPSGSRTR